MQASFRHLKNAQLICGAKAIFNRPQQAQVGHSVALKIKHGIHHMLQNPWAGQVAVLSNMPHQHHGNAALLGQLHQLITALAHLGHAARGG